MCEKMLASQLPFGSVPFRHDRARELLATEEDDHLNCLSAQCLFGTLLGVHLLEVRDDPSQLPFGSVPFRHGVTRQEGVSAKGVSQLPFGSVPFRHEGTEGRRIHWKLSGISIAFRLSAFSAPLEAISCNFDQLGGISIAFRLSAFSAHCSRRLQYVVGWGSQLPFGSVPFRHGREVLCSHEGVQNSPPEGRS